MTLMPRRMGGSGRSEEELRKDRSGFRQEGAQSGMVTRIDTLEVCALGEHNSSILYPYHAHNAPACHGLWHFPSCDKRSIVDVDVSQVHVQRSVLPGSVEADPESGFAESGRGSSRDSAACAERDSHERVLSQFPRLCKIDAVPSGAAYNSTEKRHVQDGLTQIRNLDPPSAPVDTRSAARVAKRVIVCKHLPTRVFI